MEVYCNYCNSLIEEKSYKADGKRYHLKCLRKFRKKIEIQKNLGKIKPGKENEVDIRDVKDN